MDPKASRRRILLLVSGLSPPIITETLYGLCCRDKPWVPDEIHLITTGKGKDQARLRLLTDGNFRKFLKEYKIINPIRFDESTMHVITDLKGNALLDLLTPEDNELAADFITERLREFTNDTGTELHVSLAGGRKTMGFYIGYALSLLGRPQDRLSHVLVSDGYDQTVDFYYPTKKPHKVSSRDGKIVLDAADAHVWMAEIPFVRMRDFLDKDSLLATSTFKELITLVEKATSLPKLILEEETHDVNVLGKNIHLTPIEFVYYRVFINRSLANAQPYIPPPEDKNSSGSSPLPEAQWAEMYRDKEFANELIAVMQKMEGFGSSINAIKDGITRSHFNKHLAINRKLEDRLGPVAAEPYKIKSTKNKNKILEYWFSLKPEQIEIRPKIRSI